jgi:hypothetical protein
VGGLNVPWNLQVVPSRASAHTANLEDPRLSMTTVRSDNTYRASVSKVNFREVTWKRCLSDSNKTLPIHKISSGIQRPLSHNENESTMIPANREMPNSSTNLFKPMNSFWSSENFYSDTARNTVEHGAFKVNTRHCSSILVRTVVTFSIITHLSSRLTRIIKNTGTPKRG